MSQSAAAATVRLGVARSRSPPLLLPTPLRTPRKPHTLQLQLQLTRTVQWMEIGVSRVQ